MRLISLGIAPLVLAAMAVAAVAQNPPAAPPLPIDPVPATEAAPPPEPVPAPEPMPVPPPEPVPAPEPMPVPPPEPVPAPEPMPPVAQAVPPAPPAPYRRCSGRGPASLGTCALRAAAGQRPQLQVRIERNLPARPAAIILIWSEAENVGGVMHRITPPAFATASAAAGTILTVPIPASYCAPTTRRFDVELELANGRNVGVIGQFSFPCAP